MPNWMIAVVIGGPIGLVLGTWIARGSVERKPIHGGAAARLFHYLGCSAMTASPFVAFVGGVAAANLHFLPRLLLTSALGFGSVGVAALLLIVYAIFETRASSTAA